MGLLSRVARGAGNRLSALRHGNYGADYPEEKLLAGLGAIGGVGAGAFAYGANNADEMDQNLARQAIASAQQARGGGFTEQDLDRAIAAALGPQAQPERAQRIKQLALLSTGQTP
jgi:hypothetical protein